MKRIWITGIGIVSPIGSGKEAFTDAVIKGSTSSYVNSFESVSGAWYASVDKAALNKHFSDRTLRRAANVSKYAIAAVEMAIEDSGINPGADRNTALILGMTHGPLIYTEEFHHSMVVGSPADASPFLFSDSVLNAAASNCSLYFKIKGPVHTLVCGRAGSLKAVNVAISMIVSGQIDRAIVVASEEVSRLAFSCYSRMGIKNISEGAAAIVVECAETQPEEYYCEILSSASFCCPHEHQRAYEKVYSKCVSDADMRGLHIDLVMHDSDAEYQPVSNGALSGSIVKNTGNAFAVNALWNTVASCLLFEDGRIAEMIAGCQNGSSINTVLVTASERSGSTAAMLLRQKQ